MSLSNVTIFRVVLASPVAKELGVTYTTELLADDGFTFEPTEGGLLVFREGAEEGIIEPYHRILRLQVRRQLKAKAKPKATPAPPQEATAKAR